MASVRQRQRRVLAAAGIVLGIGAVLVAASWTDKVLGSTDFASGTRFGIESSVDGGTTWASHPVGGPNPLSFSASATGLVPGSVVYAPVRLRTEVGSGAASVTLGAAGFSGTGNGTLSTALHYRVVRGAAVCDASVFGSGAVFVAGSSTASIPVGSPGSSAFPLAAGATPTAPGSAVLLCFEVGLPATTANWTNAALQNKTLVLNWPFVGTSP
ncbi:hypothetical protein [Rhodococcoides kyotonense]|uniref:SipW-cognate class signal peptide n=1 Tax=Rhodococcoides kyotonense TaxID=398843 RepID=A0A239GGN9_9NOCA|nr:hypothetical protein [Rhodococcus kyotonensis]SNS68300.1 hypothetical protein SAMN05421642_104231 [Rhodococcus kyotonensis]